MGMITGLMNLAFGDNRNLIADTAEVFRENAERAGQRDAAAQARVVQQFAAEFAAPRKGLFDQFIDGVNRLPRPLMALGTLMLFGVAMYDPVWFAARMQGLAVVPEPLWWLMGVIVGFYFGARHQVKGQEFQRALADSLARSSRAAGRIHATGAQAASAKPPVKADEHTASLQTQNAALLEWQAQHGS